MPKRDGNGRQPDGRFGPGHCGNPNGRPRKTTAPLAEILQDILSEIIPVGSRRMPVSEALVRKSIQHASSDPKAALQLLKLLNSMSVSQPRVQSVSSADDQDTMQAFLDEQRRRVASTSSEQGEGDVDPKQD